MRHLKAGRKLGRTSSHRKALMRSLATALFEHKRIHTTEAKAKELRGYAERLITKAKIALAREKQGLLPEGQKIDIHNRRLVGREIQNKGVLQELFDSIAPVVESRQGGYTRVVKTGVRRGDAARTALVELVDWANEQDGTITLKGKKKRTQRPAAKPKVQPQETTEATEEETTAADTQEEPKAQAEETKQEETQEETTAQAEETPLKEDQEPIESQVTETPEEVNVEETKPEEEEPKQEQPEDKAEEAKPEDEEKKDDDENKKSE